MLELLPTASGTLGLGLGAAVLIAWVIAPEQLAGLGPWGLAMKANTALAIALLGSALIVCARGHRRWLVRALVVAPLLLGLTTLLEHATGVSLGIDQLVARDPSPRAPGRISVQSAIAIVCLAIALVAHEARARHVLALIAGAIGGVSLASYFFDAPVLRASRFGEVALPTATALLALAIGASLLDWDRTWLRLLVKTTHAGNALRRLVPVTLFVPTLVGSLLWAIAGEDAHARSLAIAAFTLLTSGVLAAVVVRWALAIESAEDAADAALRAEREARRTAEEVAAHREREIELRELFVGVLGHDLRNPLGAIHMAAQLGARREPSPRDRQLFERILSSSGRMSRMIDQILDTTRVRLGGSLTLAPQEIDLRAAIDDIAGEHRDRATGTPIEVRGADRLLAAVDPDRLAQVLSNLIGNAIAHGTAGRPVIVRLAGEGGSAVISVCNEGPPIPPDVRETIFDPFVQSETNRRRADAGLGLGLYISREIVRAHGGTIEVESGEERTTFVVRFPCRPPAPAGERAAAGA